MAKLNEKGSLFLVAALAAVIVVLVAQVKPAVAASVYTAEMETCVRGIVEKPEKRIDLPGLVRLLFHDAFVRKFTATDLVALSGAHCIGDTHLVPFLDRLNPALAVPSPGPNEINATYQGVIRDEAASPGNMTRSFKNNIRDMGSTAVTNSRYTPNKLDMKAAVDTVDNSFYNANLQNMVRFKSDWELRTDSFAADLMKTYRDNPDKFYAAFKAAMTKLSNTLPTVGPRVEIGSRKICSATNFRTQESYPEPTKP
ncbi:hypothetical protein ACQ4PT_019022 [Festuca glaucescens]